MRYNGDKKQKAIADKWQIFSYRQKNNIALFLALLFHVCGAIGILFTPYKQWFVSNTPVNLLLMTALLVFTQKEKNLPFQSYLVCRGLLALTGLLLFFVRPILFFG